MPFPLTRERFHYAKACRPLYQRYFPGILEELAGLAQAQGCPEEVLEAILFPMYALLPTDPHCTCFARPGLLGRNSDFLLSGREDTAHLLCYPQGAIPFAGNTTSFTQMEDGVNGKGLAVGLTSVFTPHPRPGLTAGLVLRLLLETCATVEGAVRLLSTLPLGSNQTFTLADRRQAALVECGPDGFAVAYATKDAPWVGAVNRFHLLPGTEPPGWDDWQAGERWDTLTEALDTGPVEVPGAQALLAGKQGFLCQYDPATGHDTLWAAVYDLAQETTYLAEGSPDRSPFRPERPFPSQSE